MYWPKGSFALLEQENINGGSHRWAARNRPDNPRAFTLAELMLIVVILGIFAMVAVPRLNLAAVKRSKSGSTARKIVIDLRRTRSLAISDAATNNKGFKLEMLAGGPYTGYEINNCDGGATVASHIFDSYVTVDGDDKFEFVPLGNLNDGKDRQATVSAEGKNFTITVVGVTGMVECAEN